MCICFNPDLLLLDVSIAGGFDGYWSIKSNDSHEKGLGKATYQMFGSHKCMISIRISVD